MVSIKNFVGATANGGDLAGRLLSKDYRTAVNSPSGAIADTDSFTYDRSSRMLTATSERYNNVCSMTYDSAGRKETESLTVGGQTYTTTVGYDIANRQNQMIYPDGTILNRSYTDRYQLEQLTYDGNVVDTRTYDNGGRLTSCTLGNGIVDSRTYNNDNTLASISSTNADIGTYSYTWDENKNKTSETITGPLADYSFTTGSTGYDTEDRLTAYNRGALNQQWDLSLEGDWNTFTENGVTQNRTHGPTHEVNTIEPGAPAGGSVATIQHDVKGNVTSKPSSLNPADASTLTWDFDNRLTSVDTDSDGTVDVTYTYDAIGRRASKNNTVFACNGQQVMSEYQLGVATDSPTKQYAYGTYVDEPVMKDGTSGLTYYHRNQQYSITGLTDAAGNVVEHYAYDAYGNVKILDPVVSEISNSAISNPYTYTGRRYESETGDYFFRARYYDNRLGRFLGRDPLEYIDGWSLYRMYFMLTGMDPMGRRAYAYAVHPDPRNKTDKDNLLKKINDYGPFDDLLSIYAYYKVNLLAGTVMSAYTSAYAYYYGFDLFGTSEKADTDLLSVSTFSVCKLTVKDGKKVAVWEGGSSPAKGPKAVSTDEGDQVGVAVSIQTSGQGTDTLTVVVEALATHQSLITETHGIDLSGGIGDKDKANASFGYKFGITQKPGGHQVRVKNTFNFICKCKK